MLPSLDDSAKGLPCRTASICAFKPQGNLEVLGCGGVSGGALVAVPPFGCVFELFLLVHHSLLQVLLRVRRGTFSRCASTVLEASEQERRCVVCARERRRQPQRPCSHYGPSVRGKLFVAFEDRS